MCHIGSVRLDRLEDCLHESKQWCAHDVFDILQITHIVEDMVTNSQFVETMDLTAMMFPPKDFLSHMKSVIRSCLYPGDTE